MSININSNLTSSYTTYSSQNTLPQTSKESESNQDTITISSNNKYYGEEEKAMDILIEKYTKLAQQNKRYANPEMHIRDKYQNPLSPHYIHGLTDEEREVAIRMEREMTFKGYIGNFYFADAVFRDKPGINGEVEDANKKLFNRQTINNQIAALLKQNNIIIPENMNLRFTIHPNDFRLVVNGLDDEILQKRIEELLNSDNNSKELFFHIIKSIKGNSTQYSDESYKKYLLVREMKKYTGCDLKDLQVVNGKFVTESGADLFSIYSKGVRDNPYIQDMFKGDIISFYGSMLSDLAKNGYDSVDDLILSIDYKNGYLSDVGQVKGYGPSQTAWIDSLNGK